MPRVGDYARARGRHTAVCDRARPRATRSIRSERAQAGTTTPRSSSEALAASLEPGVTALVKGSRVNRLERVVERLVVPLPAAGSGN